MPSCSELPLTNKQAGLAESVVRKTNLMGKLVVLVTVLGLDLNYAMGQILLILTSFALVIVSLCMRVLLWREAGGLSWDRPVIHDAPWLWNI